MTRKEAILSIVAAIFSILLGWFFFRRSRVVFDANIPISRFKALIDDITETIIPRTDTPGARDAQVSTYIINVVENCFSGKERQTFITGLNELENYCLKKYRVNFNRCDETTKFLVVKHFQEKGSYSIRILNKIKIKILGRSFFEQMRWLTVSGYSQSMLGATQGLKYDHIPIVYLSCIPSTPNDRSWATK